jgi:hypothetical protein
MTGGGILGSFFSVVGVSRRDEEEERHLQPIQLYQPNLGK